MFLIHQVALNSELPAGCENAPVFEHAPSFPRAYMPTVDSHKSDAYRQRKRPFCTVLNASVYIAEKSNFHKKYMRALNIW